MEYLARRRDRIERRLERVLGAVEPEQLREQVRHVSLSGGKRVRPTVTVLVCEAMDGDVEDAVDFAVGIELVHSASLVVDDVIDESALRRGSQAAWATYGHGPALVTSDGLLGEAFALFAGDDRATRTVADAMVELGEGEATELVARPETEAEYKELARRKTGALFRAAAELGAIAADADGSAVDAFGRYAERVGVAFQIRDDVLDATAEADQLGKPAGRDVDLGRPSFLQVTGLSADAANERARRESEAALAALESVHAPDTRSMEYLRDLAEFVVTREQ